MENKLTIESVAKKHNVTTDEIKRQVDIGYTFEVEHKDQFERLGLTGEKLKKEIEYVALTHIDEKLGYYDMLQEVEKKVFEAIDKNSYDNLRKIAETVLKNQLPKDLHYSYSGYSDANGHSMYFNVFKKGDELNSVKVRFSDHSVMNRDRMSNEAHFSFLEQPQTSSINKIGYLLGLPGYAYEQVSRTDLLEVSEENIRGRKIVDEYMSKPAANSKIKPSKRYLIEKNSLVWDYTKKDTGLNKQYLREVKVRKETVKIYTVNRNFINLNYFPDWTMGGHHFVSKDYAFIPNGEIWIDQDMDETGREATIKHEVVEYELMKYDKKNYEAAHKVALKAEVPILEAGLKESIMQENKVSNPYKEIEKIVKSYFPYAYFEKSTNTWIAETTPNSKDEWEQPEKLAECNSEINKSYPIYYAGSSWDSEGNIRISLTPADQSSKMEEVAQKETPKGSKSQELYKKIAGLKALLKITKDETKKGELEKKIKACEAIAKVHIKKMGLGGLIGNDKLSITRNIAKAGIEVKFPAQQDYKITSALKAKGFRWSKFQKLWYAKYSDALWNWATQEVGQESSIPETITESNEPLRTYTVDDIDKGNFTYVSILSYGAGYFKEYRESLERPTSFDASASIVVFSRDRAETSFMVENYLKKYFPKMSIADFTIHYYPNNYKRHAKDFLKENRYLPSNFTPDVVMPKIYEAYKNASEMKKHVLQYGATGKGIEPEKEIKIISEEITYPTQTDEDLISVFERMGEEAFGKGLERAPSKDAELVEFTKDMQPFLSKYSQAWYKGYDEAKGRVPSGNLMSEQLSDKGEDYKYWFEKYSALETDDLVDIYNKYYKEHVENFGASFGNERVRAIKDVMQKENLLPSAKSEDQNLDLDELQEQIDEEGLSVIPEEDIQIKTYQYYKGTDVEYKNRYELNKAIEELISIKDNFSTEEKIFISRFSGYGGLDKFGATGKGIKYEFFTPDEVIRKMWALAFKHGYRDGAVLEPSVGVGRFLKYAPDEKMCTGIELNEINAKICRILYPEASILHQPFEKTFIKNNLSIKAKVYDLPKYALCIGNPPYGKINSMYWGMGEDNYTHANNWAEYFIRRGLDLLVSGGLLVYVIGAEVRVGGSMFTDQGWTKCKKDISEIAEFVDAYKLPSGIFQDTGVSTEIIVLKKL